MDKQTYDELVAKITQGSVKQNEFKVLLKEIKGFTERIKQLSEVIYLAQTNRLPVGQFTESKESTNDFWFYSKNQIAFKSKIERRNGYEYWFVDENGRVYSSNYSYDYSKHQFDDTFQVAAAPTNVERLDIYISTLKFFITYFPQFEQRVIDFIKNC